MEVFWYALSHGTTRPVVGMDIPLWFEAMLLVGLLCAGTLLGSGLTQWCMSLYRK